MIDSIKLMPNAIGVWQIKSLEEIHRAAEKAMSVPESMFQPQRTRTSVEAREIQAHLFAYTNLCYYRRDLLTVIARRAK